MRQSLTAKLQEMTTKGVIKHPENCQCDHCANEEAGVFLSMIQEIRKYDEAPTRPY